MEVEGHDRLLLRGAGVPGGELNARFNWVASPATTQAEFFKGVSLGESQAAMHHHHTYWGGGRYPTGEISSQHIFLWLLDTRLRYTPVVSSPPAPLQAFKHTFNTQTHCIPPVKKHVQ